MNIPRWVGAFIYWAFHAIALWRSFSAVEVLLPNAEPADRFIIVTSIDVGVLAVFLLRMLFPAIFLYRRVIDVFSQWAFPTLAAMSFVLEILKATGGQFEPSMIAWFPIAVGCIFAVTIILHHVWEDGVLGPTWQLMRTEQTAEWTSSNKVTKHLAHLKRIDTTQKIAEMIEFKGWQAAAVFITNEPQHHITVEPAIYSEIGRLELSGHGDIIAYSDGTYEFPATWQDKFPGRLTIAKARARLNAAKWLQPADRNQIIEFMRSAEYSIVQP